MTVTISNYAQAFNRLDAEAIVSAYRFPLCVIADGEPQVFSTSEEFTAAIQKLLGLYQAHNFQTAKVKSEKSYEAFGGIRVIDVAWELYDKNDDLILAFEHTYLQDTTISEQPFVAALSHNEMSKWRSKS